MTCHLPPTSPHPTGQDTHRGRHLRTATGGGTPSWTAISYGNYAASTASPEQTSPPKPRSAQPPSPGSNSKPTPPAAPTPSSASPKHSAQMSHHPRTHDQRHHQCLEHANFPRRLSLAGTPEHRRPAPSLTGARCRSQRRSRSGENFLHVIKGGSLRSPPATFGRCVGVRPLRADRRPDRSQMREVTRPDERQKSSHQRRASSSPTIVPFATAASRAPTAIGRADP